MPTTRTVLTVVSGPPCSGKSTYVAEHARPGDVVIDLDQLAHALGHPTAHLDWAEPETPTRTAALVARASVLKAVRLGRLAGARVWLVDSNAVALDSLGVRAVSVVLDPGEDVCRDRAVAAGRPASTLGQIGAWYARRASVAGAQGSTSEAW